MDALKNNFQLLEVEQHETALFDADDLRVLETYMIRNKRLAQLIKRKGTRPFSVEDWTKPDLLAGLKLSVEAGAEELFRFLLLPLVTEELAKSFEVPASVRRGCGTKFGWEAAFCDQVVVAYCQFMELKKRCKKIDALFPLSPPAHVASMWKEHMSVDRQHYEKACHDYHGRVIEYHEILASDAFERTGLTRLFAKSRLSRADINWDIWSWE